MEKNYINVIGAGLAGCEAAWQAAERGVAVRLYEMKPEKHSPAHHLDTFAELVCSNSLRSDRLENAVGLLKEELRRLGSLIMRCADACRVPAGGALAVDRERFSAMVTEEISRHPNITVLNSEITELPDNIITVTATGPLTSEGLSKHIALLTGEEYLYFYDAAAPIVTLESIDMSKAFKASRYGKGEEDYINCPMNREQYDLFQNELVNAETAPVKEFEKEILFEGCMPVESMAARGYDTMRFGPLKPVGLIDPATGKEPYAAVQLRQDNVEATLYNMVGFQTHLKWPEQKRVFGLIPGLENAEFVRYGVMHRNTYINSPKVLNAFYRFKTKPNLYFAGQLTGVEGYIESTSSGFVAGLNAAMDFLGGDNVYFSRKTAIGALSNYVSDPGVKHFQPMNINYGLIDTVNVKTRDKKQKYLETAARALSEIDIIKTNIHS